MATIKEVKEQIQSANALGIANLTEKGVEISENATTYEIMSKIEEVSTGLEALDHTVTFTVDDEPYQLASVKDGDSVNAPPEPVKAGYLFTYWKDENGERVDLPFIPADDIELSAYFSQMCTLLYNKANVSQADYPYLLIAYRETSLGPRLHILFLPSVNISSTGFHNLNGAYGVNPHDLSAKLTNLSDVQGVVNQILPLDITFKNLSSSQGLGDAKAFYANFDYKSYSGYDYYPL